MKKLIVLADWAGDGSVEVAEVKTAIEGFLKSEVVPDITFVKTAMSTLNAGFLLDQMVYTTEKYGRPLDTVIFVDCDPNKIRSSVYILHLKSGIYVIGPNAGNNFSFIRGSIEECYTYPIQSTDGVRSRDTFAKLCAYFLESLQDDLEIDEIDVVDIASVDGFFVGNIDQNGNIMTTIKEEHLKGKKEYHDHVRLKIGPHQIDTVYRMSFGEEMAEEITLYPDPLKEEGGRTLDIGVWKSSENTSLTTLLSECKIGDSIEIVF